MADIWEAKRLVTALDKMGDWIDWEPETIRTLEIEGKPVDEITFNKIMALQTVFRTQVIEGPLGTIIHFDDWKLFEKVVIALNDTVPNFAEIESATPLEIHRAIMMLEKIHNVTLGGDAAKYIAASYMTANIVHCPFYKVVDDLLEETTLKKIVKEAWKDRNKIDLSKDGVLEIQLSRLMAIESAGKGEQVDG